MREEIIIGRLFLIRELGDCKEFILDENSINNNIILTETQSPELEPIIRLSKGVISKIGGRTGHIAIICNALKKPYVTGGDISIKNFKHGDPCLLYGDFKIAIFHNSWRYLGLLKDLIWYKGNLSYNNKNQIWKSEKGEIFKINEDKGVFTKVNNYWKQINILTDNKFLKNTNNSKIIKYKEPICPYCLGHIKKGFFYKDCSCGQKYHPVCFEKIDSCYNCKKEIKN